MTTPRLFVNIAAKKQAEEEAVEDSIMQASDQEVHQSNIGPPVKTSTALTLAVQNAF